LVGGVGGVPPGVLQHVARMTPGVAAREGGMEGGREVGISEGIKIVIKKKDIMQAEIDVRP